MTIMDVAGWGKYGRIYALRGRYVFPVDREPIAGGWVTVAGDRIAAVGQDTHAIERYDLGDVAILPGLVNTHTHLEFSYLNQPLGEPGMPLADWIALVTASRPESVQAGAQEAAENAMSAAVARGLGESLAAGTTTLGEIAVAGWSPLPFQSAALDSIIFRESICLSPERFDAALATARQHLMAPIHAHPFDSPSSQPGALRIGLSPHAPYTVHPKLFARLVDLAIESDAPLAFHLAESLDELELLRSGGGRFFDYLAGRGFWVPGAIPLNTRPLDYLRQLARARRALVVHGNYLDDEEQAFLADHRDRLSVVYCPRTHAYFGHQRHPLEQLLARGARVALGTDSRASNPDLSLLAEMRYVAHKYPAIERAEVLRMGTLTGAAALGLAHESGSLAPGKLANLAIVAIPATAAADPHDLLFDDAAADGAPLCRLTIHRGRVAASATPLDNAARAWPNAE